jgi:hypothetical protein
MTDNTPQEGKITQLDATVFGSEDNFRAALAKIGNEPDRDSGDNREEIPQDVQQATREAENNAQEGTNDDAPDESFENPEQLNTDDSHEEQPQQEVETKGHMVPKSRLNQELEKRKGVEVQLLREREERIRAETQLQMLTDIQKQQQIATQEKQSTLHTIEDIDPLDTETYNYAKREIDSLKLQLANVAHETQARTQEVQYHNMVMAQEAAYAKEHPDFHQAMKHVQDVEFNIAKDLLGDERTANEYVGAKLRDVLTRSLNSGKNAADTIYKMAKTYGYNTPQSSPKAIPTKNVAAINKNMERSANTGNMGNNSSFGHIPTDIASAMNKSGNPLSGVNPDTFQKMIHRLMS